MHDEDLGFSRTLVNSECASACVAIELLNIDLN